MTGSLSHLSPDEVSSLQAFVRFYEQRRAAIAASVRERLAGSPIWSHVRDPLGAEPGAFDDDESIELQRQAIFHGLWEPYLASLRARGEHYARAGVDYAAWFELTRAYRDAVGDQLAAVLAADPARNAQTVLALMRGMDALIDLAIQQIGEAYLDTKQRELSRSESLHRAMFEHSPVPMWTYDRTTLRFCSVNEAAVRHYGYTRDELAAMTIADIRPAEDVSALRAHVAAAQAITDRQVWTHRKKDGTLITVEVSASDLAIDDRPLRLVSINDVTEKVAAREALRETEEQLRHAQKMEAVGRLATSIAHDFNNVLTVVQSYACILEDCLDPSDTRREDAATIRRAAERGAGITRQLLALGHTTIGEPTVVDVDTLIEQLAPILRRVIGESITLAVHATPGLRVLADAGQLQQVILNLVINARDAIADRGRITIESRVVDLDDETARLAQIEPGRYVEIAVADTGCGMDAETQTRIFEPFFTTKELGKGTGLGLSVVHGILKRAGGRVVVYSEPGRGSTFRVQLPIAKGDTESRVPVRAESPTHLGGWRVLVVDDQPEVRTVAARVLRDAGCHVIEASSANEARNLCVRHEEPIDLVLLDVVLPDGRGDALIEELRALRPAAAFVLMSGHAVGGLASSSRGADSLVPKPFTPSELRAAIAHACGGKPEPESSPTPLAGPRYRILVVDDDGQLRHTLARLLERADLQVVEASSGEQAIAALGKQDFDVVVSDVNMPDGGGLDLLRAVRRVDLDVPVILMTGEPSVEAAAAAVEYGAFRYVTKPFDTGAFVATIKHAARAHALARIRREASMISGAHAGITDRAGLEVRFEQALAGMHLAFQPIVHAATGALYGVEALMRSSEPSLPHPGAVLEAAAQLGRLSLVGRKIRLLSSAAFAPRRDDIALFVNLHPEDLHDADLVHPESPLSRIAPRVVLEITERASLDSSPELTDRISRLRQLGFRLAVDDIGAGYSGLSSFAELTPEVVKVDMSLVRDVHKSALKQRTIAALCRLCHDSGALVVGEGVETVEERDTLVELGCDLLQGYLIARPQPSLP